MGETFADFQSYGRIPVLANFQKFTDDIIKNMEKDKQTHFGYRFF
jgi:hypothetical protein